MSDAQRGLLHLPGILPSKTSPTDGFIKFILSDNGLIHWVKLPFNLQEI